MLLRRYALSAVGGPAYVCETEPSTAEAAGMKVLRNHALGGRSRRAFRLLLPRWTDNLVFAAVAIGGASAAAFTGIKLQELDRRSRASVEMQQDIAGGMPDLMSNICRGKAAP